MNTQISRKTTITLRKCLVLLNLLFLLPSVLSASPILSNNIFKKNHSSGFEFYILQRESKTFIIDTLENPGLPATASDYVGATYPGGARAWMMHLNKTFRYPPEALNKQIQGTVTVKFLIDSKGRVKKPEAVGGPGELRKEAIRVIKQSGRWIPATINGGFIESYKEQTIIFKTEGY